MAFHLPLYINIVINSIDSLWKRVNALVPGVVNMDEWLNVFHAVIVIKNTASCVCTKTNARENALVRPARVVTTIHAVSHG